jgi:hypothetical protein
MTSSVRLLRSSDMESAVLSWSNQWYWLFAGVHAMREAITVSHQTLNVRCRCEIQ